MLGVLLTARLGWWQLDRAAQKLSLQAQIDERRVLPPLSQPELARSVAEAALQHQRRITLQGRWLPQYSVFLDNRPMAGRQGFFLVTPLELSSGGVVLVQRGWAPRDLRDRAALPAVPTPTDVVMVTGLVAPPPGRLYALGGADTGVLRQNLDIDVYARETSLRLRPLSIQQTETGVTPDGLRRDWPNPAVDVHKHHGYAFQWFALSSLMTGLYVWFQILQPRRRRSYVRT